MRNWQIYGGGCWIQPHPKAACGKDIAGTPCARNRLARRRELGHSLSASSTTCRMPRQVGPTPQPRPGRKGACGALRSGERVLRLRVVPDRQVVREPHRLADPVLEAVEHRGLGVALLDTALHDGAGDVVRDVADAPPGAGRARPARGPPRATCRARAFAASRNISFVTRRMRPAQTPRPTPGNTNALLHWPMRNVLPPRCDGLERAARGDERPAVRTRRSASAGVHSALRGRVAEREHERPLGVLRHVADDLLGEDAGRARGAQEDRGLGEADRLLERDPGGILHRPSPRPRPADGRRWP